MRGNLGFLSWLFFLQVGIVLKISPGHDWQGELARLADGLAKPGLAATPIIHG
jgi:hypothetical protein